MIWEALLVIGCIALISIIAYSYLVIGSNSQKQEEDFKAFLEEMERLKRL